VVGARVDVEAAAQPGAADVDEDGAVETVHDVQVALADSRYLSVGLLQRKINQGPYSGNVLGPVL
jgi:hypothetical protein